MYIEGREQCNILWKFIKKKVPGFENCWLIDTGTLLGVRDSRRIIGEYVLTGMDIAKRAKFDDVVAISWRTYDIHNPTGPGNIKWIDTEINGKKHYVIAGRQGYFSTAFPPGGKEAFSDYMGRTGSNIKFPDDPLSSYYDIPYRCLVPLHIDNLLVAGRCLSSDFPAQSATRLVMACNAMGEAAGTAAAVSLKKNLPPRKIERVELQKTLINNNCSLGQEQRNIPGLH